MYMNHKQDQSRFDRSCVSGNIQNVRFLVVQGGYTQKSNSNGHTALMVACANGHLSTVKVLIERQTDIDFTDNEGRTLLHWLCVRGDICIVNILLDKGCDMKKKPDEYGETPLMIACRHKHLSIVQIQDWRCLKHNRQGRTYSILLGL